MTPKYVQIRALEGKRVLVSAPRPDSFMLRMRSLREAGRMALSPAARMWQSAGTLRSQSGRIDPELVVQSLAR